MILYAWVGNVSVLASFLTATVPGVLLTIAMSIFSLIYLKNDKNIVVYSKEELKEKSRKEKELRKIKLCC
jgi:TRAP-type C4-dicarboxylate transport system permease large subunit